MIRLGDWCARKLPRSWLVGKIGTRADGRPYTYRRTYPKDIPGACHALREAIGAEYGWRAGQWAEGALERISQGLEEPVLQLELPNFEDMERVRVLDDLAEARADYLERIRDEMRLLYLTRYARMGSDASVTPDDARRVFEELDPPGPEQLSRNFLACVFRTPEWEWCGTYKSRTKHSHGNRLNRYRLRNGT